MRRSAGSGRGRNGPSPGSAARARVLAGLAAVDCVVLFDEDTPLELIQRARARRARQGRRLLAGPHRRRRLGRGPRRPRRASAAGRPAFQLPPSWSVSVPRPDGRTTRSAPPARARAARQPVRRRLLPHSHGRHAGPLHGERGARRAGLQEGHAARVGSPPSTPCCRAPRWSAPSASATARADAPRRFSG